MNIAAFREKIDGRLAGYSKPIRYLLIAAACLVAGAILFWLFNQVFYYYLTKSYVDEVADAYDLNRGFAGALLWATFPLVVVLAGLSFSFSKQRRMIGYGGLLSLLIAHGILVGLVSGNFDKQGVAARCYVLTRNSVKVLNRPGIDPETGRECRLLTPVMQEKIALYQRGARPTRLLSGTPTFFSAISGEPVVWYSRNNSGGIELFDLMGYHPQTGEELTPVTRAIVDEWKVQVSRIVQRAPVRIDPNTYAFFDPQTGRPKVWYWRNESDEYEFYDGPGFQPRTGEPLGVISRDAIAAWKKSVADAAAKKKAEQERQEQEAKSRAEAEQRERDAATEAAKQRMQAANNCDRMAANPTDVRRTSEGTPFDQLKAQADIAYEACTRAVQQFPDELRYQYQLGRTAQFKDRKQAFEIFTKLVAARYPAAFDNLGGIYLYDRKDVASAIRYFTIGASLDDADSMTSLADLVDHGMYGQQNPYQIKWALLNKAAVLGHAGAQRAVAEEKQKAENQYVQQQQQREAAQNAAAVFGAIIGGMGRR